MTRTWLKLLLFVAVVLSGVAVLILAPRPDVEQLREWVAGGGPWVPVWFVLGYAAATLLLVPRTVLSEARRRKLSIWQPVPTKWAVPPTSIAWMRSCCATGCSPSSWPGWRR